MDEFVEGNVVICSTSQAGTIIQVAGNDIQVLLANGDIWTGAANRIRFPQDKDDLDACPLNVERFEERENFRPRKKVVEE